jgi:hypothetical protein
MLANNLKEENLKLKTRVQNLEVPRLVRTDAKLLREKI